MRSVKQMPVGTPQNADATKFPDGGVINETTTTQGTPVVEEIIGDILTNIYALLRAVKMSPDGTQDGATSQYQILQALRLLTNELNDSEQVLSLAGSVFSVPLNLALFPDKYFIFARPTSDYVSGNSYTIKGNGTGIDDLIYNFSSNGFKAGDELLIIIDSSGARGYNLSGNNSYIEENVFTPFGTPLSFNDSNLVWYKSETNVFNDKPESFNIKNTIVSFYGSDCDILDTIVIKGYMLCLVYNALTTTYSLVKFSITNLSSVSEVSFSGLDFPSGINNNPFMYSDGDNIYITNDCGNSATDGNVSLFTPNLDFTELTFYSTISLDSFDKTTNLVIKEDRAYTLVSNDLHQYDLSNGDKILGNSFPTFVGLLFGFNKLIYYSNGEVAKKWNLPIYT